MKFQGCFEGVLRVFQGSVNGVSRKFQGCFQSVSNVFQGSFITSTRIVHRCAFSMPVNVTCKSSANSK